MGLGLDFFASFIWSLGVFFQIKVNIVWYDLRDRDWTSAFTFKYRSEFILKVTIYLLELDFWSQKCGYNILIKAFIKVGRNELHWQLWTYILTFSAEKYRIVFFNIEYLHVIGLNRFWYFVVEDLATHFDQSWFWSSGDVSFCFSMVSTLEVLLVISIWKTQKQPKKPHPIKVGGVENKWTWQVIFLSTFHAESMGLVLFKQRLQSSAKFWLCSV